MIKENNVSEQLNKTELLGGLSPINVVKLYQMSRHIKVELNLINIIKLYQMTPNKLKLD